VSIGSCSSDKAVAVRLAADAGVGAPDAGRLCDVSVIEGLTAVLVGLDACYGVNGAGVRIAGLRSQGADQIRPRDRS
jgi:hypothetical protein